MTQVKMLEVGMENRDHSQDPVVGVREETSESVHSSTRRAIARIGVGAPILMTLASRPALAGQCLSNMLSGNLSSPDKGHCSKGWSPGGWGQPGGTIHIYSTLDAWTLAGYSYGTLKSGGNPAQSDDYKGGSKVSETPFMPPADKPLLKMREALQPPYSGTLLFHLIAAWLNAKLSAKDSTFQYILTPEQVVGLANGSIFLPQPYTSLTSFLDSTW